MSSNNVENDVVSMKFDNKNFEQNVSQTLNTIAKLKNNLDFSKHSESLMGLSQAANKVDFSGMSNGLETVSMHFSALQVMATTVLANITNSATMAAKSFINSWSLQPVVNGFHEYETQINAIQTILANTESKGTTLGQVNNALNQLNTYADKTIYNFTEMTQNIGTFTAAGVGLEKSVSSIKGIANLAALSGSTSMQASAAMYQLSQAIASGTVKLMDWNSVVNAGMGGQVFQDSLKETARVHGIAIDDMIKKEGSFRETLQNGWLTADILTETLNKFTGDLSASQLKQMGYTDDQIAGIEKLGQTANDAATKVKTFSQLFDTLKEAIGSGWTNTWQIIVGNFDEAKEFLTNISNTLSGIINESATKRNNLLLNGLGTAWDQFLNKGINDEEGFKDVITNVAKDHGIAVDDIVSKAGTFQKSLKDGWLTTDILTESVGKFTDKVAGMSAEELRNAGYTTDQVKALQDLNTNIQNGKINVDKFTKAMTKQSGRELLIDSLTNSFNAFMKIAGVVKDSFRAIFPEATAKQIYGIAQAIDDLSKKLMMSKETSDYLGRTLQGIFAFLDIGRQIIVAIIDAILPLSDETGSFLDLALSVTAIIGDWIVKIDEFIKKNQIFENILMTVSTIVSYIIKGFTLAISSVFGFLSAITENVKVPGLELIHAMLSRIYERLEDTNNKISETKSVFSTTVDSIASMLENSKLFALMKSIWGFIQRVSVGIVDTFGKMINNVSKDIANASFTDLIDFFNATSFGAMFAGMLSAIKSIKTTALSFKDISKNFIDVLDSVRTCFESYQKKLKADILMKLAIAIGILSVSLIALSMVDSDRLMSGVAAMAALFGELLTASFIFNKLSDTFNSKGSQITKSVGLMIGMSVAVLLLADAMRKIGELDWNGVAKGLVSITVLTGLLIVTSKELSKNGKKAIKGAGSFVIFAIAINIMASACKKLGELDIGTLVKGLTSIGILMTLIALFLNETSGIKGSTKIAVEILILAAAMNIFAKACSAFGSMDAKELAKGLGSIAIILTEMAGFSKLVEPKKLVSTGIALTIVASSMLIFASAVSKFGSLSVKELVKGLGSMAIVLTELAFALNTMPKNLIGIGAGMVIVGASLNIIAAAITTLGNMDPGQLAAGLIGLGVALAELAVGLLFMKETGAGSLALLVAAAAIAILAPALALLGAMSWEAIAKSLIMIAGAFTVFGVAAMLLEPIIPAMLLLAGALTLLGVACTLIAGSLVLASIGLQALAIGITALGAAVAAGVTGIVAALSVIVIGIADLIPLVLEKLGEGIVAFIKVIGDSATQIATSVTQVVSAILTSLTTLIPQIVSTIFQILSQVLATIVTYAPQIIQGVITILLDVLQGIADNIQKFVDIAGDIVVGFINGIADKLPDIIQAGFNLIISFINGMTDAINKNTDTLITAMQNLIVAVINASVEAALRSVDLFEMVGDEIMNSGLIKGIRNKIGDIKDTIGNGLSDAVDHVRGFFNDFYNAGAHIVNGLINGIKDKVSDAVIAISDLGNSVIKKFKSVLGIKSPSRVFKKLASYVVEGFSIGLKNSGDMLDNAMNGSFISPLVDGIKTYASLAEESAKSAGDSAASTFKKAMNNLASMVDGTNADPVIRPVLDLSNVQEGATKIGALFNRTQALKLSASINGNSDNLDSSNDSAKSYGNKYQFVQNNYSPKELSKEDIYRQTHNQFSAFERLVEV